MLPRGGGLAEATRHLLVVPILTVETSDAGSLSFCRRKKTPVDRLIFLMRETADTAHAGGAISNPRNKTFPEALLLLRGRADR